MKLNKILSFAAAMIACTNLFAADIFQGKIINEKEWSNGKVKFNFIKTNDIQNLATLNQMNLTVANEDQVSLVARAGTTQGTVNNMVRLDNYVSIMLRNNFSTPRQYNLMVNACTETGPNAYQCSYHTEVIALDPNGSVAFGFTPILDYPYSQAGNYNTYVQVQVLTPEMDSYMATGTGVAKIS